jgi:Ni/Co efflux regulator RcnB
MKSLYVLAVAAALLFVHQPSFASPQNGHGHGRGHDKDYSDDRGGDDDRDEVRGNNPKDQGRHDNGKHKGWEKQAFRRGDRLPERYETREYYITDYERYHLRRPDSGYRWVRADDQFIMVNIGNSVIVDISLGH